MSIDDSVVQTVKERADIVEIISSFIQVKRAGRNFLALCPFHNEKSPSFNVSADNQFFHCFGCGASGDVITFLRMHENVDFVDAVKILADRYGVIVPESGSYSPEQQSEKARMYDLHRDVSQWFRDNLQKPSSEFVREYLSKRGITDADITSFQIGYAPDSWDELIKWAHNNKYSTELLEKAGLVVRKEETNRVYDRFRDRIMFSIWNDEGKTIAFSGRVLQKDAPGGKYVNSPETMIFHKSSVLYGLPMARKFFKDLGSAILCEGQMDVIACHRAGLKNAVSTQGTAFTEDHARKLKRYADKVVLAFDADSAGKKAAFKSLEYLLPTGLTATMLSWGEGQDPDSLYAQSGPEALKNCVDKAKDIFEVLLDDLIESNDINTAEGKSKAAHVMIENIARIPDSIIRSSYCQRIAERLGIHVDSLFRELNRHYRNRRRKNSFKREEETPVAFQAAEDMSPAISAELILIELAVQFEDVAMQLHESLPAGFISPSVIGSALKDVIDMSLAGDWFSCKDLLQNSYLTQSRKIAEKVFNPEYTLETERGVIDRALRECLRTIKEAPLKHRKDQIINLLRDPNQDATALKREYQQIMKEIKEL
jgi:DNA primase